MPDNFMPDVEVHIAFNAGFTTPAASRTWTDVSQYVELADRIAIAFGRQDERSTAGANTLSLTLDNSDGRFTAARAASPYFPNVKIGRPIRVRVTPPGGATSVRFVGFIDEWPVEWEGTSNYAKAKIRASSRLSRLGLSAKLVSMPEEEILDAGPAYYWTMGDPSGATAAAEAYSGPSLYPVVNPFVITPTPVVFGSATGPGVDGLTAVQSTSAFSDKLETRAVDLPAGPRTIRCWVLLADVPPSFDSYIARAGSTMGIRSRWTSGDIAGAYGSGTSINDGRGHDVMLVRDGSTEVLYVDGVQIYSVAAPMPAAASAATFVADSVGFAGTMAHCAIYNAALSPAQAASQAAAMDGFGGERTDQRLVRVLDWAGVASSEITAQTGVETMAYQQTSGQSYVDVLREVEATENGVLFDGRDGNVTFHNRSNRYVKSTAATLNMAAQHVGADYSPKLDRSTLLNDVEVSNPSTGEKAKAASSTSADEYGIASGSSTSVANAYDPLLQKANWMIASYAEPRNRVPSLTVDVLAHQGLTPSAQTLLALNVGDVLAVTNAPTQADTTTPSYFVEGYTETIGPESYQISYNLSPTYPTLNVLVLNDATRGQLDAGNVLAL